MYYYYLAKKFCNRSVCQKLSSIFDMYSFHSHHYECNNNNNKLILCSAFQDTQGRFTRVGGEGVCVSEGVRVQM